MNAPVRRIDEILALPHSVDDFKNLELPPSDDDSWLYGGEDELNAALQERQKEMEDYNSKHKNKQNSIEEQADSDNNLNDYDLKNISESMQEFVKKMSSYQGAEVPESRLVFVFGCFLSQNTRKWLFCVPYLIKLSIVCVCVCVFSNHLAD